MISLETRRVIACLIVGAALAAGAWFALVQPRSNELNALRARVASDRVEVAQAILRQPDEEVIDARTADLIVIAESLIEYWSVGANSPKLFEQIASLSRRAGVRITQVSPRSTHSTSFGEKDGKMVANIHESGYAIDVEGQFQAIAEFIDSIQNETGMGRIEMVKVRAVPNDPQHAVRVTLTTRYYHLEGALPTLELVRAQEGGDHD